MDYFGLENGYLGSGFVGGARFSGKPSKETYISMLTGKYMKKGASQAEARKQATLMWDSYVAGKKATAKKAPAKRAAPKKKTTVGTASRSPTSAKALASRINKDSAKLVQLLSK